MLFLRLIQLQTSGAWERQLRDFIKEQPSTPPCQGLWLLLISEGAVVLDATASSIVAVPYLAEMNPASGIYHRSVAESHIEPANVRWNTHVCPCPPAILLTLVLAG